MTCGFQASVYSPLYAAFFTIFKVCVCFLFLCPSAIAPDFSQNLLNAQTLTRQGGDVLIECKPRMSPRGIISWRKGKEALRETHRYTELCVCVFLVLSESYFINLWFYVSLLGIHGLKEPSRSVTPHHLNCIKRSARWHSASTSLPWTVLLYFDLVALLGATFCNVYPK